ncbi:MAG: hypothetical protein ACK5IQ_00505 [Bacteroidales bacterium]
MNKKRFLYSASFIIFGVLSSCNKVYEDTTPNVDNDAFYVCTNLSKDVDSPPSYYWYFSTSSSSQIDTAAIDVKFYGEYAMHSKDSTKMTYVYSSEKPIPMSHEDITVEFRASIENESITSYDLVLGKEYIVKPAIFDKHSEWAYKYIYASWDIPSDNKHDNFDLALSQNGKEIFSLKGKGKVLSPTTDSYLLTPKEIFSDDIETMPSGTYLLTLKTLKYSGSYYGDAKGINCMGVDTMTVYIR